MSAARYGSTRQASPCPSSSGIWKRPWITNRRPAAEPILQADISNLYGGLRSRIDWSGNPALFTRRFLQWLQQHYAVEVLFNTEVTGFEKRSNTVTCATTAAGPIEADAFVIALGAYAGTLCRTLGIRLPIYPVKGYSVTIPSSGGQPDLRGSVIDSSRRLAISRFGDDIRVTFRAEFAGFDKSLDRAAFSVTVGYVKNLFGEKLDYGEARYWAGFRPMTPNGLPIIGPTRFRNLFLNVGHGHLGWTMAPATSRALSHSIGESIVRA